MKEQTGPCGISSWWPAASRVPQLLDRLRDVRDPVDKHGLLTLEVLGQEDAWRLLGELHHGDTRAHALDGESSSAPSTSVK